jgi:hypothetical protein
MGTNLARRFFYPACLNTAKPINELILLLKTMILSLNA